MSCVYALHWRLPALSLLPLQPSGSLGFYLCSWAVPLRGPMWERYTVVLALPPCKSRNATQRPFWPLHSSVFGTCILAALVCIPCMLVPVPLATTGRTLHALEPGLGGAGFWLHGVLHVLLRQVLVLDACLCSMSFFAVVGHGVLVLAFSALPLIYASPFSWAVPLRGPKRERYTVVLAPPPCNIPTTTTINGFRQYYSRRFRGAHVGQPACAPRPMLV